MSVITQKVHIWACFQHVSQFVLFIRLLPTVNVWFILNLSFRGLSNAEVITSHTVGASLCFLNR